jgi:hypothetical protein
MPLSCLVVNLTVAIVMLCCQFKKGSSLGILDEICFYRHLPKIVPVDSSTI